MKRLNLSVVLLALFVFGIMQSYASDVFNKPAVYKDDLQYANASGDKLGIFESANSVTYKWQFTYVDSSNAVHSPLLYVADINVANAYIEAVQSATGDANVIWHFSADRDNWSATTAAGLDAVSNTAKLDTLGTEAGVNDVKFRAARWLVIEAVGGSTNNHDGNVFEIVLKFKKDFNTLLDNGTIYPVGNYTYKYFTAP